VDARPVNDNTAVVEALYRALSRRDGAAMAACYAPDATFSDPVFPDLHGEEVGAMWRMLCERAADIRVAASDIRADGVTGTAHVEAWYPFSATGRKVHNVIEASFRFSGGTIAAQRDSFDFWRWSRQALGPRGLLLGWTPLLRNAVRRQARRSLERAMGR
jgi:ketosteroid isomerase-like protein